MHNIYYLLFNKETHYEDLKHKFNFTLYIYGLLTGTTNSQYIKSNGEKISE